MLVRAFFILGMCIFLVGCGTTSSIYSPSKPEKAVNLQNYDHVIVNNFYDRVPNTREYKKIRNAGRDFAYLIATKLRSYNVFKSVKMNKHNVQKNTLLVEGKITQYEQGDANLRNLIGFGMGVGPAMRSGAPTRYC